MASRLTALLVAALAHGVAAWLPNTNFTDWGWCALAHFNHTDPAASTLNMALTGYASFYYVSLVPPGEQWTYRRDEFPKFDDGFFTASLAAYDMRTGLPIGAQYFDDVMATNNETVRKMVSTGIAMPETPREGFTAVLQRLYLDDRRLTPQDLPGFLFEVYGTDGTDNAARPVAPADVMAENSQWLVDLLIPLASHEIHPIESRGNQLLVSCEGGCAGVYPDPTNVYADVAPPADMLNSTPVLRVTGWNRPLLMQAKNVRYLDFMAVNHATTATDDALPFYKWPLREMADRWTLWVAPMGAALPTRDPVLHWAADTPPNAYMLTLRVMDVSCYQGECTGLAKASKFGTVSAAECAAALGELYPTVEYFTLDEATAELARHGDGHGDEDKDETTVTA